MLTRQSHLTVGSKIVLIKESRKERHSLKRTVPAAPGFIITNFPVFLSSGATLTVGAILSSGDVIALEERTEEKQ